MKSRSFNNFLGAAFSLTIMVLLAFVGLNWLGAPAGRLIDWLVGIASFWWLLVVVTVPWNIHFQAREVLAEAAESSRRQIQVQATQVDYARRWVGRSLAIAIALHLLSALALYALAATGVSPVGYISAGAALLLTALRPVVRAYEYVAARLAAISREVRYPHDDIQQVRADLTDMGTRLRQLEACLDTGDAGSWAARQQAALQVADARIDRLQAALDDLRSSNLAEHTRLAREAQSAIAQISADGQFLNHVREIIRFVKEA